MKIVIDTNVLVSGFLRAGGPPAAILREIVAGRVQACYDPRILGEYRDVLHRPRFGFDVAAVEEILNLIEDEGFPVVCEPLAQPLPDPDDSMFVEVAIAAQAVYLVTGNLRHFPPDRCDEVDVLTPRQFLTQFLEHGEP